MTHTSLWVCDYMDSESSNVVSLLQPYDGTNQWQKFKITIPTVKQHGSLSDTNQQQPPCRVAIYSAADESYLLYPGEEYVKALPYKVNNPFLFVFKPLQ